MFTGAFPLHECGVTCILRTYFTSVRRVFLVKTVVLQTVLWDIRMWSARFLVEDIIFFLEKSSSCVYWLRVILRDNFGMIIITFRFNSFRRCIVPLIILISLNIVVATRIVIGNLFFTYALAGSFVNHLYLVYSGKIWANLSIFSYYLIFGTKYDWAYSKYSLNGFTGGLYHLWL